MTTAASGRAGAPRTVPLRRDVRRAQITDRAARIFQRHGYASTSMQGIADAVGLSKASLYYYVHSKHDLLFLMLEEVNLSAESIVEEVSAMGAPPLERLAAYLRAWAQFNVVHLAKVAVYNRDLDQLDSGRRRLLLQGRERRFQFVADLVREAQRAGAVAPAIDAEAVAHTALGMVGYMYTWYRPGAGATGEQLGDLMADMVVAGLDRSRT